MLELPISISSCRQPTWTSAGSVLRLQAEKADAVFHTHTHCQAHDTRKTQRQRFQLYFRLISPNHVPRPLPMASIRRSSVVVSIQCPHLLGRSSGFPPHSGCMAWTIKLEHTWLWPCPPGGVCRIPQRPGSASSTSSGTLAQHRPISPSQSDRKSTTNSRHQENRPNTPAPEYAILFPTSLRQSR